MTLKLEKAWLKQVEGDTAGIVKLSASELPDAVVEFVKAYDWVTFVELERRLSPHMEVKGDIAMSLGDNPKMVIWAGMSDELVTLIEKLLAEKRLYMHPAQWLTYMIDGGSLSLPLVRRPNYKYKHPHWLPTCLRVVPIPKEK